MKIESSTARILELEESAAAAGIELEAAQRVYTEAARKFVSSGGSETAVDEAATQARRAGARLDGLTAEAERLRTEFARAEAEQRAADEEAQRKEYYAQLHTTADDLSREESCVLGLFTELCSALARYEKASTRLLSFNKYTPTEGSRIANLSRAKLVGGGVTSSNEWLYSSLLRDGYRRAGTLQLSARPLDAPQEGDKTPHDFVEPKPLVVHPKPIAMPAPMPPLARPIITEKR